MEVTNRRHDDDKLSNVILIAVLFVAQSLLSQMAEIFLEAYGSG